MKKDLLIAVWFTLLTTVMFGFVYPIAVTGLSQLLFPSKANGQLLERDGKIVGSRIIGQPFSGPGYFHSRPSAAGTGYDATASSGSNLGPTNKQLLDRVQADVQKARTQSPSAAVPVDLVTASGSGLDPHISPAAAEFQIASVARERKISESELRAVVRQFTQDRQFGILGEPRVNVLELNLALDHAHALPQR
jgi:potassium-transporting ATPase KdpC subunit